MCHRRHELNVFLVLCWPNAVVDGRVYCYTLGYWLWLGEAKLCRGVGITAFRPRCPLVRQGNKGLTMAAERCRSVTWFSTYPPEAHCVLAYTDICIGGRLQTTSCAHKRRRRKDIVRSNAYLLAS